MGFGNRAFRISAAGAEVIIVDRLQEESAIC